MPTEMPGEAIVRGGAAERVVGEADQPLLRVEDGRYDPYDATEPLPLQSRAVMGKQDEGCWSAAHTGVAGCCQPSEVS